MYTDPDRLRAWLPLRSEGPPDAPRLFCLPYSGGSATVFRGWARALTGLQVAAVQYPGRGSRIGEPLARRMADLVEPLLEEAIVPLADRPFALFGHSMGAVVAFELARRLRELGRPPRLVMLSAHGPPHPDDALHLLPDAELLERLRGMGGTPETFFNSPELIDLALPIVRADLELLETHTIASRPLLDCPVVAFAGDGDQLAPRDHLERWRPLVATSFTLITLAGEHFFVHDLEPAVLGHITRLCREQLGSA